MNFLQLYKNIYDPNILLLHKGNVSFDLIGVIINSLEESVENIEDNRVVKKKFNNLITESFQNLGFHAEQEKSHQTSNVIMVISEDEHYSIITGNVIDNTAVDGLCARLEEINEMSQDELRKEYKKVMSNDEFSNKGTAGLGFIDMARKTKQKLRYTFYEMDTEKSYFSFEIIVKKSLDKDKD